LNGRSACRSGAIPVGGQREKKGVEKSPASGSLHQGALRKKVPTKGRASKRKQGGKLKGGGLSL